VKHGAQPTVVTLLINKTQMVVVHIEFLHGNVVDRDAVELLLFPPTKTIDVDGPRLLPVISINADILAEIRLLRIGETVGA
jgi:hypothetical protein